MNPVMIFGGLMIWVAALVLFALVANADWRYEWLQLVTMAVLVGAVAFGLVLMTQGLWTA